MVKAGLPQWSLGRGLWKWLHKGLRDLVAKSSMQDSSSEGRIVDWDDGEGLGWLLWNMPCLLSMSLLKELVSLEPSQLP